MTNTNKQIETCFSPALLPFFNLRGKTVVVVDVLRATSAICTGIAEGVKSFIPIKTVKEAEHYKSKGYLVAAERMGQIVEGFDLGNSPFTYQDADLKDKSIAFTTTNGTNAIIQASDASRILIGSFLNLSALSDSLANQGESIVILCAGWRNKFNLEDTLFAGALAQKLHLLSGFDIQCDATLAAMQLYNNAAEDLNEYIQNAAHVQRLQHLDIQQDIDFCLEHDRYDCIPVLVDNEIRAFSALEEEVSETSFEGKNLNGQQ